MEKYGFLEEPDWVFLKVLPVLLMIYGVMILVQTCGHGRADLTFYIIPEITLNKVQALLITYQVHVLKPMHGLIQKTIYIFLVGKNSVLDIMISGVLIQLPKNGPG